MVSKVQNLFAEYGRTGVIVYFTIFFLTLFGFWTLLTAGVDIRTWPFLSNLGDFGALGLAYAATKVTQPIRIALTLLSVPFVARFFPVEKNIEKNVEKNEETSDV